ncbi:MAG: hypothetical protein PHW10_04550 [Candidatus Peribacteraceae bacterium]|nr:hypothetical protein [Candidatus Peribacteraceae bacterium]
MATRKLDRDETDFMRDYIQEGVDRGETKKQIQERRRELTTIVDCTIKQVAGAVAWKNKGEEKLVLEQLELSPTPEEQQQPPSPETQIQAATTFPSSSSPEVEIVKPPEPAASEVPPSTWQNSPDESPTHIRVHPKSGAWADYEHSEIKETWRAVEAKFIDENVDANPEKRAKMRIICTPGIKCYLEMRHILAKGFRPENIVAVERDDKAWSDFEMNAKALGIRPIFGDLSQVLRTQNAPFDIALLDFVGQQSIPTLEAINRLPLAQRAIVAITTMAKRESAQLQYSMAGVHRDNDGSSGKIFSEALRQQVEKAIETGDFENGNIIVAAEQARDAWNQELGEDVSHEIRDTILWHTMRQAGSLCTDRLLMGKFLTNTKLPLAEMKALGDKGPNKGLSEEQWRSLVFEEAMKHLASLTIEAEATLWLHSPVRKNYSTLRSLGLAALTTAKMISKLEKYRYKSKIGQTPSPFFTNLAVIETPIEEYRKMMKSIHFVFECCRAILSDAAGSLHQSKRHSFEAGLAGASPEQILMGRFTSDAQIFFRDNERRVSSVRLLDVRNDLAALDALHSRYPLNEYENQKQIPRIALEDLVSDSVG